MNFLLVIKIFKRYGIDNIDIKILDRIENDKNLYIQSFRNYLIIIFF